jgi:putative ABC transport system substrate-binding protein
MCVGDCRGDKLNSRRKLVIALGAGALATPFTSFAQQQGKVWRVGFLWESEQSDLEVLQRLDSFKTGMRDLGYVEGRDYAIEQRSAQNELARLPSLIVELLSLRVDVIVVEGTPSALAGRNSTRVIPILIATVGDPVGSGLAATLSRPGGNVTGLTALNTDLYSKRLDFLRQMLPGIRRVGFLYNPDNSSSVLGLSQFESDCAKLKFTSLRLPVRKSEDIGAAFNRLKRDKAQGLIVTPTSNNIASRAHIIELAAKHRLPAVYSATIFGESGGLISYAANNYDLLRRTAAYADKIFKGAKPGDLPIEQPTTFDMVVNLKTAKSLGIKIPNSILVQATKVIE